MAEFKKIVLIEINEFSSDLFHRFRKLGRVPNLDKLYKTSATFETTSKSAPEDIQPWVQWVDVHSGQSVYEHNVKRIGQVKGKREPALWDVFASHGHAVGVCSGMNMWRTKPVNGFFIKDPWCDWLESESPECHDLGESINQMIRAHDIPAANSKKAFVTATLKALLQRKISLTSVVQLGWHAVLEKFTKATWKRALLCDKMMLELFKANYRATNPEVSVFFSNGLAHLQHRYWRYFEPEFYDNKPSPSEIERYKDVIPAAYQETDRVVGELLKEVGEDTTVIFLTALSQRPVPLKHEITDVKFYRPVSTKMIADLGQHIGPAKVEYAMANEFRIECTDRDQADKWSDLITTLNVKGDQLYYTDIDGNTVHCCTAVTENIADNAQIFIGQRLLGNYSDLFIEIKEYKSGFHDRRGDMWIKSSKVDQPTAKHQPVSLEHVAPSILVARDLPVPEHMADPLSRVAHYI